MFLGWGFFWGAAPDAPSFFLCWRLGFGFGFIAKWAMAFQPGLRAPDGRPLSERSERGERIA